MQRSLLFCLSLGFSISLEILILSSITIATMADNTYPHSSSSAVYIVYTERPLVGVDPESHHLRTLSSVIGSEEAAKEALLYVYKSAATGFSAKLTADQVSELSKQPGVLHVMESERLELHSGGTMNSRNC